MFTDDDLKRLKDLESNTTPGPWKVENVHPIANSARNRIKPAVMAYLRFGKEIEPGIYDECLSVGSNRDRFDADFMAFIKNNLPALLARLEAADKVCMAIEAEDMEFYLAEFPTGVAVVDALDAWRKAAGK